MNQIINTRFFTRNITVYWYSLLANAIPVLLQQNTINLKMDITNLTIYIGIKNTIEPTIMLIEDMIAFMVHSPVLPLSDCHNNPANDAEFIKFGAGDDEGLVVGIKGLENDGVFMLDDLP